MNVKQGRNAVRVEILLLNGTLPQMFAGHERRTFIADSLLFLIRRQWEHSNDTDVSIASMQS